MVCGCVGIMLLSCGCGMSGVEERVVIGTSGGEGGFQKWKFYRRFPNSITFIARVFVASTRWVQSSSCIVQNFKFDGHLN